MRFTERLIKTKQWVTDELCKGRMMKTPGKNMSITDATFTEPKCFIGFQPTRPDATGYQEAPPINVCPSILIMPNQAYAKNMEEQRFDQYNKISRPKDLGQQFSVDFLFSVYEPGIRMPGFLDTWEKEKKIDMTAIQEATEEGFLTLFDWMNDMTEKLLRDKCIPHTDLILDETKLIYSPYIDQSYVVDKRPFFFGFVKANFYCSADEGTNSSIDDLL